LLSENAQVTFAAGCSSAELIASWVAGWALSRDTVDPTPYGTGWRVQVDRPGHVARVVLPDVDPSSVQAATDAAVPPGTWLKVAAEAVELAPLLPGGWSIGAPEYLLHTALAASPAAAPAGYRMRWTTVRPGVADLALLDVEDQVAAKGRIAVRAGVAVVDQVVTDPGHRRRGQGSIVMTKLAMHAARSGAATGVLVATEEGLGLYRRLGWSLAAPITAAVRDSHM
jgi:ribosomal protein S18 acetylase RimI-like enzyme